MKFLSFLILLVWIAGLAGSVQAQVEATSTPELDPLIYINAVAWSHDGSKIAAVGIHPQAGYGGYIRVVDAQTGQIVFQRDSDLAGFTSVAWSPDDRFIALGSFDATVHILDVEAGAQVATLEGHQATVTDVSWSPDGERLISSGNWDQSLILWNPATSQPITEIRTRGSVQNVAFSPNSQKFAVGTDSGLYVFPADLQVLSEQEQAKYRYSIGRSGAIAWSPNGNKLAFGTQTVRYPNGDRPDANIILINIDNRTSGWIIPFSWGSVSGLAWSPDDALLAVYGADNVVKILNPEDGSLLDSFVGSGAGKYSIGNLEFSPDGRRLAYGIAIDPTQPPDDIFERSGIRIAVINALK